MVSHFSLSKHKISLKNFSYDSKYKACFQRGFKFFLKKDHLRREECNKRNQQVKLVKKV